MKIIVGKSAGFCYGVRNAVTKSEENVKEFGKIDCLGELVHNGEVIKRLERLGLNIIDNIEKANEKVIIRAHGIPKDCYENAKKLGIEIFDYTCPNVVKIHNIVEEWDKNDGFIFLVGNKQHPETIGTISFCGKNSYIIETPNEIDEAISSLYKSNKKNLLIIVQTTFSLKKFDDIVSNIRSKLSKDIIINVRNTICNATRIRQEETEELSKKVECMIIIGGRNSSNTKKLFDIAKTNCSNVFMIESEMEIKLDNFKKYETIGIMAGTSTPQESILKVKELLEQ